MLLISRQNTRSRQSQNEESTRWQSHNVRGPDVLEESNFRFYHDPRKVRRRFEIHRTVRWYVYLIFVLDYFVRTNF